MGKLLDNAIIDAKRWLTEDERKTVCEMKSALRAYADENEGFQNMIFEIGLKKLIKNMKDRE